MNTADVLDFWFGELDSNGLANAEHSARWWKKDPTFDEEIRERFRDTHKALMKEREPQVPSDPRELLAQVIVLDQFPRNMFRDKPEMYGSDLRACEFVLAGLNAYADMSLKTHERVFLYMPLMHSESLRMQNRCVKLFEKLTAESDGKAKEAVQGNVKFATAHRDIIEKFERFPHRNEILGRESSKEEIAFLKEPGSSF